MGLHYKLLSLLNVNLFLHFGHFPLHSAHGDLCTVLCLALVKFLSPEASEEKNIPLNQNQLCQSSETLSFKRNMDFTGM